MTIVSGRAGNKRGQGALLREEIVAAAERLLASTGSTEAVTLRAIAREAGIAAPSIYPHFADRDSILDVVISRTFDKLADSCREAAVSASDRRARIEAIARAYVAFAREHPGNYRMLFERSAQNIAAPPHPYPAGIQAFDLLTQALENTSAGGREPSEDAATAQVLFAGLHGIAVLPRALPGFPWENEKVLIQRLVEQVCAAR